MAFRVKDEVRVDVHIAVVELYTVVDPYPLCHEFVNDLYYCHHHHHEHHSSIAIVPSSSLSSTSVAIVTLGHASSLCHVRENGEGARIRRRRGDNAIHNGTTGVVAEDRRLRCRENLWWRDKAPAHSALRQSRVRGRRESERLGLLPGAGSWRSPKGDAAPGTN